MSSIPIVKFDGGITHTERGALFDLPAEFFTIRQMAFYANCKAGWSKCPLGYDVYCAFDKMGIRYVVPGIMSPENKTRKKIATVQSRFTKEQIERFLQPYLLRSDEIKELRDREFKNLIHDLRPLSSEIYHDATEIRTLLESNRYDRVRDRIEDIIAAQQMISMRIDLIDYENGQFSDADRRSIPIFRKVDKVVRSFRNKLRHKKMKYNWTARKTLEFGDLT